MADNFEGNTYWGCQSILKLCIGHVEILQKSNKHQMASRAESE